jgi:hypothetical protein
MALKRLLATTLAFLATATYGLQNNNTVVLSHALSSPLRADPVCNATAYDEAGKFNTTNRCEGVPCKRDD